MVEDKVKDNCHVLTLSHKCADWCLLKMLISGKMAGKILNKAISESITYSMDLLLVSCNECLVGRFNQYESNNAIKIGTLNKEPTVDKMRNETL